MPELPPDRYVDRSKIEDYLLHPINGRGKAAFFEAYGFSLARWDELHSALLEHAASGRLAELVVRLKAPVTLSSVGCAHPTDAIRSRWCAACGRPIMMPPASG
jgi:hypothetical protein